MEKKHDAFVLVALQSIWAKEVNRFARIWIQTTGAGDHHDAVPSSSVIWIGSRIGDMHGFSYMQFIVPGLIMMAVITNSCPTSLRRSSAPSSSATLKNCWWRRCRPTW